MSMIVPCSFCGKRIIKGSHCECRSPAPTTDTKDNQRIKVLLARVRADITSVSAILDYPDPEFKPGDRVSYCTKDQFGYVWHNCIVQEVYPRRFDREPEASLRTDPGNVAIMIPLRVLTKVKTVWMQSGMPFVKGEN